MPLSLISSFINSKTSQANTYNQYRHNLDLLKRQQAFEAEQAAINRKFQLANYYEDRRYNDYSSQVQRMQAAGLNPNLMMSQGQLAPSTSTPNGAQGSSGLASVGAAPTIPFEMFDFESVANGLKSLGEAEKLGVETSWLQDTFKDRALQERASAEVASVNALYAKDLKESEMENITSDTFSNYATAFERLAAGDLAEAQQELVKAQEQTEKERKKLTAKQAEYQEKLCGVADRLFESQIRSNNASAFKDETTAKYIPQQVAIEQQNANTNSYNARTNRISAIADKNLKESLTKINNLDFSIRNANAIKEMAYNARMWAERSEREGLINEQYRRSIDSIEQQISQAADRHDWYMVEILGESMKDMCIGFGAAKGLQSTSYNTYNTDYGGYTKQTAIFNP